MWPREPLGGVPLTLRVPQAITRAYLVPGHEALPTETAAGAVRVTVPEVQCHRAVVLGY